MSDGFDRPELSFLCEAAAPPPAPEMGPDGYARLILSAWARRSEEDVKRYVNDKGNRPVNVWFRLDG